MVKFLDIIKKTISIKKIKKNMTKNFNLYMALAMFLYVVKEKTTFLNFDSFELLCLSISLLFLFIHYLGKIKNQKIIKIKKQISLFFPKNKLIIVILIITICSLFNWYQRSDIGSIYFQEKEATAFTDPVINDTLYQAIDINNLVINRVSIRFATYERTNNSYYRFQVIANDKAIVNQVFNSSILHDGDEHTFKFDKLFLDENTDYKIAIQPLDADNTNCITVFKNASKNVINYSLSYSPAINWFKLLGILIFTIMFLIVNYIINTKKISTNKFYLICGIYMVALVFIIPPYQVPDEPVHYYRAYKLSQVSLYNTTYENFESSIIYGPDDSCLDYSGIQNQNSISSKSKIIFCLKEAKNTKRDIIWVKNLYGNNPINHFVPAVGIKIADLFVDSPLLIFFSGRLANLLVSFILIYLAIKKAPKNKVLILLVATVPMFLQQMCSYSYDSLLNAVCLFVLAYELYLMEKEKMNTKDILIMGLMSIIIFSIKSVYIFVMLPLLFNKIKNNKALFKKIIVVISILLISYIVVYLWAVFFRNMESTISQSATAVIEKNNFQYLISNPSKIFPLIVNTFQKNGVFYARGLIGYFGWFSFKLADIYIWIYLIITYLIMKNNDLATNVLSKKQKIISMVLCLIMFAAPFAAMYLYWSGYGSNCIDGVQGRYFIPLIGLLFITIMPRKQKSKLLTENDVFSFVNIIIILYIITVICQYY